MHRYTAAGSRTATSPCCTSPTTGTPPSSPCTSARFTRWGARSCWSTPGTRTRAFRRLALAFAACSQQSEDWHSRLPHVHHCPGMTIHVNTLLLYQLYHVLMSVNCAAPPGALYRREHNKLGFARSVLIVHNIAHQVGRCTLTPPDPQLKGAWFQPLHLSSEKAVSECAFQIQLVPLQPGPRRERRRVAPGPPRAPHGGVPPRRPRGGAVQAESS